MPDRGKLVVATIVAVALGLAIFAWYWRWQQGHRAAEFWGAEVSQLIRGATEAELLVLQPFESAPDQSTDELSSTEGSVRELTIEGRRYSVAASYDLANSPGLIHARHSLTEDASFLWGQAAGDCLPSWTHAMRLSDGSRSAVLAFDFNCRRIHALERDKSVAIVPRIAEGFRRIVQRTAGGQQPAARE